MFKTHHKMKCWNREFQYFPAKIIGKIVKYQYLPTKTTHFSLSHLTLPSLSHIPLSPFFSWLWLLGEAQNLCFCTILSEISENHLCILQYMYLATVALKTQHKIDTFFLKVWKDLWHRMCNRIHRTPHIVGHRTPHFSESTPPDPSSQDSLKGCWKLRKQMGTSL